MPLFTFSDRQKAESADSYALLADGRHYRLRAGLSYLPVASSVRMADLSHRLAAFEEPDGLRIEPLSHALLAELAALFFEADIPVHVLMEHHPEELIAFVNIGMGEPDEKKEKAGPDETGASILRVADRYKVDPHHIYTSWPAWMLNAAIEGLPQVAAHESMQLAEAVQVGNGNMKPGALRSTQQQWRREAKGQAGNGGGALAQLNTLAAMALRQRRN